MDTRASRSVLVGQVDARMLTEEGGHCIMWSWSVANGIGSRVAESEYAEALAGSAQCHVR